MYISRSDQVVGSSGWFAAAQRHRRSKDGVQEGKGSWLDGRGGARCTPPPLGAQAQTAEQQHALWRPLDATREEESIYLVLVGFIGDTPFTQHLRDFFGGDAGTIRITPPSCACPRPFSVFCCCCGLIQHVVTLMPALSTPGARGQGQDVSRLQEKRAHEQHHCIGEAARPGIPDGPFDQQGGSTECRRVGQPQQQQQ